MATIIRRRDRRVEIRESTWTPSGPRSRTLAIGPELTDDLLDHAAARASRPFDRNALIDRAAALGVHHTRKTQPDTVPSLLEHVRERSLWPTHVSALRDALVDSDDVPLADHLEAMTEWMGKDDAARGRALVDVLKLADAVMRHRPESRRLGEPLCFPQLRSCRHR